MKLYHASVLRPGTAVPMSHYVVAESLDDASKMLQGQTVQRLYEVESPVTVQPHADALWRLGVLFTDERGVPDGGARVQREARERRPTVAEWARGAYNTQKPMPCGCDPTTTECRAGSFDKCQAIQHGMAQHAAAADAKVTREAPTAETLIVEQLQALDAKVAGRLAHLEDQVVHLIRRTLPPAPGWDRVDARALVQHVADLERNLRIQTEAADALTERVDKLEAAVARPAEMPSYIPYHPVQPVRRWWWQR